MTRTLKSSSSRPWWRLNRREQAVAIVFLAFILAGAWLPGRVTVATSGSLDHRLFFLLPAPAKVELGDYLVFRHQGRYYLADYKSNHLGPELGHYGPERLDACMREHRYPLQYLIYTLALHRYLRHRMADYSYEAHFGGVRYLFLRAMHPKAPTGTGIVAARPEFRLIDGLDRCCRGLGVR